MEPFLRRETAAQDGAYKHTRYSYMLLQYNHGYLPRNISTPCYFCLRKRGNIQLTSFREA